MNDNDSSNNNNDRLFLILGFYIEMVKQKKLLYFVYFPLSSVSRMNDIDSSNDVRFVTDDDNKDRLFRFFYLEMVKQQKAALFRLFYS